MARAADRAAGIWPAIGLGTFHFRPPVPKRDQTIGQALRGPSATPASNLLMAGYFVCGFQVVFIGVHMPSYLRDNGLSPQVASYALALIGLFNVFGTYIRGHPGAAHATAQDPRLHLFARAPWRSASFAGAAVAHESVGCVLRP